MKIPNPLFIFLTLNSIRLCTAQICSTSSSKCGPFGICNPQGSPTCTCLRGFYARNPYEWNAGNWSSGCSRSLPLHCGRTDKKEEEDWFLKQDIIVNTGNSHRWFGSQDECKNRCLSNCSCLAYGFDAYIGCLFWTGTLTDIQRFPSGSNSVVYVRLAGRELDGKRHGNKMIIILVVVGFVITSIFTYFIWKWMAKRRDENEERAVGAVDTSIQDTLTLQDLPAFKFETLAIATDNFSEANKLGKGGFGPVYKEITVNCKSGPTKIRSLQINVAFSFDEQGNLANGREIAVKRLSQTSTQGMQEFMNEIVLISKLQHRNLVRLLGCCVENKEIMLIYEYMPNKSLDFYLFDSSQEILDWRKRFDIIKGTCRGLLYLHRDSRLKIIHRDLKPSNILLDNNWNPKISDFGMARIFATKQDHVSTLRVVGTYGYMAPEYAIEGRFSTKSDVFSFGVVVLEIATGRRNTSFYRQDGTLNLLGHVWKLWNDNNFEDLIDPRLDRSSYATEVVRCIHIGLLCVQKLPEERPSISTVLSMLSSEIIELPKPKQSAFTIKSNNYDTAGTSSEQAQKSSSSINNVTVTMIDGR